MRGPKGNIDVLYYFRINGAHVSAEDIAQIAETIRSVDDQAAIMMDLPGNKVRFQNLGEPLPITTGELFHIRNEERWTDNQLQKH